MSAAQSELFSVGQVRDGLDSGAIISACGRYRYRLWRAWGPGLRLPFLMLNPSTADATQDDPTIRRCIGFAKREGFDGIEVVNLFAWRSPYPTSLLTAEDPVGPENDEQTLAVISPSTPNGHTWGAPTVAAWGSPKTAAIRRLVDRRIEELSWRVTPRLWRCLGRASDGHPRHPLMLPAARALTDWP